MQGKDFSIFRRAEMQMKKDVAQDFQGIVNSTMTTPEASQRNRWCANGRAFNRCRAFFLCVAVLLFVARANSQTAGAGSIQGTVTDPSGAVIPNASVSLTEASTHVTLTTKSTSTGTYVFPNIKVGTYSVSVVAPGFETYTSTGNVLEIGSSIAIDAKLTVGSADAKIVVRSEGLALQTEDASFKQTIDNTELTQMPLNGRHMTDLVVLAGGSNAAGVQDATGSKFTYQSVTISVAGASGNSISYRLDGGDNQDYMGGGNNPLPFPDAVSQFSVETAVLGAQDGVHSGGLVNVVTVSGTNHYHGSGFEFIRNNFIDATNFFVLPCVPVAPVTHCTTKDTLHQNQYGGTFGGPVRIPKLFNGTNKLFFFAAYQHQKTDSSSATSNAYVPTAANLAGDFSITDPAPAPLGTGVKNICGTPLQLYDPITGAALPGNKYNQPGGPALPVFNAASLKLLNYLPKIVPLPDGSDVCGHVQYAIPSESTDNQFDTRVDYAINAKNNMYGRYFIDSYQLPAFYSPTNILLTTQSGNPEQRYQTITLGENFAYSPSTVNSAHFTAVRRLNHRGYNPNDINANTLGVDIYQIEPVGLFLNASAKTHGFNIGGDSNSLAVINDNIPFDVSDDLTLVRGRHQIVLGGQYVRNQLNLNNAYRGNGVFNFNGTYSGSGPAGGTVVGDVNLDFLEGAMIPGASGFQQSKAQQNALRGSIPTLYVQDTFRATKTLTLVAGISWQPLYFPVDYFHRGTTFDMGAFLANKSSSVYTNAPAGSFYYGDPGVPGALTHNSPWNFNPNFGFTSDVLGNGKLVFRGGVALVFDQPNFFVSQRVQQSPPFATQTTPNTGAQLCFSHPWLIGGVGAGCSQVGGTDTSPFPQPQVPTPETAIFPAQSQYIVLQNRYQAPNTVQWTASIQQQFAHGWTAEIQYIGNRTQHLLLGLPLSPAVFIPGVWGPGGTGCAGIVTTGPAKVKPGAAGTNCSTTGNQNSRYALTIANPLQGNQYLGGGGGSLLESNSGYANYNGMIATLQHRLSSTFSLLVNYTFSKCLNNSDPQGDISGTQFEDPSNPSLDYGRCGSETRNIFNASIVAKSAFPIHGFKGYLLNDWELAPLIHTTSGSPINITTGSDVSLTGVGNDRPNQLPGVNPYKYAKIYQAQTLATRSYLNQAAFAMVTAKCPAGFTAANCPQVGTFGNLGRNSLNGPMLFNMDARISRIFPIGRKLSFVAGLEAFNVLNHPSFSNPNSSNPTSGTFGYITGTSNNARVFQLVAKVIF
jgi:hypothetical protein